MIVADSPADRILAEIVEPYIQIASRVSRYAVPEHRPIVLIKSEAWFISHPVCDHNPDCPVMGLFNFTEGRTIYLRANMLPSIREEVLVHELVHWLQRSNGMTGSEVCSERAVIEGEAYLAAYKYLVYVRGYRGGFYSADLSCP